LDVSNLFLVTHPNDLAVDPPESEGGLPEKRHRFTLLSRASTEEPSEEDLPHFVRVGLYTSSGSLAIVVFGITVVTLLHASQSYKTMKTKHLLDHPFIKAIPRVILIIIIPCLPLMSVRKGSAFLAIAVGSISFLMMLELFMGYRRHGDLIEPVHKEGERHDNGTVLKSLSTVAPISSVDLPESPRNIRHAFTD